MIKYKKLLVSLNVLVALTVLFYGIKNLELDPITMVVSVFVTLTTLILVNLVYFDLEKFVLNLLDKQREKASLDASASQAN